MSALTGTGRLLRLALRRDRLVLGLWILGLTVFLAGPRTCPSWVCRRTATS